MNALYGRLSWTHCLQTRPFLQTLHRGYYKLCTHIHKRATAFYVETGNVFKYRFYIKRNRWFLKTAKFECFERCTRIEIKKVKKKQFFFFTRRPCKSLHMFVPSDDTNACVAKGWIMFFFNKSKYFASEFTSCRLYFSYKNE